MSQGGFGVLTQVRWSEIGPYGRPPPTCVLLHGILGSRRNLTSFAHRLVEVRLCTRSSFAGAFWTLSSQAPWLRRTFTQEGALLCCWDAVVLLGCSP